MWKIELFAVLVQLVLLFFAIDAHFKANFESFEVCNLEKLAERFVLITSGDFDLSNITDPLIRSKVKTGLSGKAKGEEGDCKGLSSVIYGYGRAPFSFLYMQDQESIFSRIKTNYFGHHQSTYPGLKAHITFGNNSLQSQIESEIRNQSLFLELEMKHLVKYIKFLEEKFPTNETLYIIMSKKVENCSRDFLIWGKGVKKEAILNLKQVDISAIITTILGETPLKKSIGFPPFNYTESQLNLLLCYSQHLTSLAKPYLKQIKLLYNIIAKFHRKKYQAFDTATNIGKIKQSLSMINMSSTLTQSTIAYLGMLTYIGWIFLLFMQMLRLFIETVNTNENFKTKELQPTKFNVFVIFLCFFALFFVVAHKWPNHRVLYFILPLIIWRMFFSRLNDLHIAFSLKSSEYITALVGMVLVLAESEFVFWSIRSKFLAFLGFFFALLFYTIKGVTINWGLPLLIITSTSGITYMILMFIPTIPNSSIILLNIGSTIWFCGGLASSFFMLKNYRDFVTTAFCLLHLLATLVFSNLTIKKVIGCCVLWALGIIAPYLPLMGGNDEFNRIQQLCIVMISPFIVFSANYELISMFALTVLYICWYLYDKNNAEKKFPTRVNLYYSFFYIILLYTAIHSLGYKEDMTQVDLTFVERLGDIKCLFVKGLVITLKVSLIIILLTIIFCAIHRDNKAHLLLAIVILNFIGFRFFIDLCYNLNYDKPVPQLLRYCVTQLFIIILITTQSFVRLVLYTQFEQAMKNLKNLFQKQFEREIVKEKILTPFEK